VVLFVMSLRRRLILTIGGLVVSLLVVLELLGYFGARAFALSELEQEGGLLARYQAERVRASLNYAEVTSEFLLRVLQLYDHGKDSLRIEKLLEDLLNGNRQLSAVEIWGMPRGPMSVRRTMEGQVLMSRPSFDLPRVADWTLEQQKSGRWVLPQSDPDAPSIHHVQRINGITVVVEVPVRLLAEPLEQAQGSVAYGFLATGAVVLFTNPTVPSIRSKERYDFISQILMERGQTGDFFRVEDPIYGKSAWVGTAPVGDLNLTVGVVYLEDENFRPLYGLAWGTLIVGVLGIGALLMAISLTARSVARPLVELSHTVDMAVSHGFSQRVTVPPNATLEVERLALSCNRMLDDITHFIERLEDAAEERQAMESELAIAAEIQGSMLPKFPFQGRHCEAVGFSCAAKKVGGDFVNIFPVGANQVGFFIGDVSGKGIPGAITMAFTTSLLEHLGRAGLPPEECLGSVNRALCARDEATSFVTVFFGVLSTDGSVVYGNGGHHPPTLFHGKDGPRSPVIDSGLALGIYPEAVFGTGRFQLEPGERLMLYTDGVTEAMNEQREEYGEARFEALIAAYFPEQPLCQQLEVLHNDVERFRAGAIPNDDLTVLLLRPVNTP
jgi:serine phosphatase RsbU (regulator of sigma subunit)